MFLFQQCVMCALILGLMGFEFERSLFSPVHRDMDWMCTRLMICTSSSSSSSSSSSTSTSSLFPLAFIIILGHWHGV
ncbi:hypothetical protein HDV57DRAFT_2111 [Trichoderma longibrachiatum]